MCFGFRVGISCFGLDRASIHLPQERISMSSLPDLISNAQTTEQAFLTTLKSAQRWRYGPDHPRAQPRWVAARAWLVPFPPTVQARQPSLARRAGHSRAAGRRPPSLWTATKSSRRGRALAGGLDLGTRGERYQVVRHVDAGWPARSHLRKAQFPAPAGSPAKDLEVRVEGERSS